MKLGRTSRWNFGINLSNVFHIWRKINKKKAGTIFRISFWEYSCYASRNILLTKGIYIVALHHGEVISSGLQSLLVYVPIKLDLADRPLDKNHGYFVILVEIL